MPPNTVVPVIVVPGIMGTNLRAKRQPRLGMVEDERNKKVGPGEPAWRPPNGARDALAASFDWDLFSPMDRQLLLDGATLEVDGDGPVSIPDADDAYVLNEREVRERGWGEVHADSYGELLYALQMRLNQTFGFDERGKKRFTRQHWKDVMACDPQRWGVHDLAPLTEGQLEKHARHYFPVYAVGYCWLLDCEASSRLLERRILAIIDTWTKAKRRCSKVIIVTHSMGGLVARACARRIPDKIAGIVHGVMPAFGAPAAYRRIACGMETSSPGNDPLANFEAARLAKILGASTDKTTPVLATSAGALELLPNHLYPHPWLHVRVIKSVGQPKAPSYDRKDAAPRYQESSADYLHFPNARTPNPYDLYRDMRSWYRLINPELADPGGKFRKKPGAREQAIRKAITAAERFHRSLGDYYHPHSYAFYGNDHGRRAYGQVRWTARQGAAAPSVLTPSNVAGAGFLGYGRDGQRRVLVEGISELHFAPDAQDASGDGTVPSQSGAGVTGKVKQGFATSGYDHQESYKKDDMLMLTLRLIVRIVQEIP